jgi:hypothetical protein
LYSPTVNFSDEGPTSGTLLTSSKGASRLMIFFVVTFHSAPLDWFPAVAAQVKCESSKIWKPGDHFLGSMAVKPGGFKPWGN